MNDKQKREKLEWIAKLDGYMSLLRKVELHYEAFDTFAPRLSVALVRRGGV